MKYLIDTNVISELVSPKPNRNVINWFNKIPSETVYLSVLTIGEIRKGIEKLNDSKRKQQLLPWLEHELPKMFDRRILSISVEVADRWGRLLSQTTRTLPAIDSLIAATALHHDMALVTRNITDYNSCQNLELINPWELNPSD